MAGVIDPLRVTEPASPRASLIRARAGFVEGLFRAESDRERDGIAFPGFQDRACLALGGGRISPREERRREAAPDSGSPRSMASRSCAYRRSPLPPPPGCR